MGKEKIKQYVRYLNYQEILEVLQVDCKQMQKLVDKYSLRKLTEFCKVAGLSMHHIKLVNSLRAGGIKFKAEVGRRPLSDEEKIKNYEQEILIIQKKIAKIKLKNN